jgi:hypothetical protein
LKQSFETKTKSKHFSGEDRWGEAPAELMAMINRIDGRKVVWTAVLLAVLSFCVFMVYGLVEVFRPKDVSKMPPRYVFQWLVCDPIPGSVTNIKATGRLMFAGHGVVLNCDIAPSEFNLVLTRGNFVRTGSAPEGWFGPALSSISSPEFYQRRGGEFGDFSDGLRAVFLLTSTNHDRLLIRYSRR